MKEGQTPTGPVYETKSWWPPNLSLQEISLQLRTLAEEDTSSAVWNTYLEEAIERLAKEGVDFARPAEETDKLYMSLGGSDVIEVTHPQDSGLVTGFDTQIFASCLCLVE